MFKFFTRTLVKGLAVMLPFAAAAYVLVWVVRGSEGFTRSLLLRVIPEGSYFPGMGIALLLAIVFCVGLLMYPWLTRSAFNVLDKLLRRIPLFGSVYSPARDLMNLFGGDIRQKLGRVVAVEIPNTSIETVGFVTRDDLSDLPAGINLPDHVVVYVQWSSQIGGYCFIVPRSAIRDIDMTVEEGMRWALTAGISAPPPRMIETPPQAENPS